MVPFKKSGTARLLDDGFAQFSTKAVKAIKSIMSGEDTIVLTTSHKENYSLNEWLQIFGNRGIELNRIMSLEPNKRNLNRKDEILQWVKANKELNDFVIIDDDLSLNSLPTDIKSHLVLISPTVGLTIRQIEEIKIKKRQHPPV